MSEGNYMTPGPISQSYDGPQDKTPKTPDWATRRERPIILPAATIKPLQSGIKTQTRQVIRGPLDFLGGGGKDGPEWDDPSCWGWADEYGDFHTLAPDGHSSCDASCCIQPKYQDGDVLWVREAWYQCDPNWRHVPKPDISFRDCPRMYRADDWGEEPWRRRHWRSPATMPRWAARIFLRVIEAQPERLHAITEEDAIAEGARQAMQSRDGRGFDNDSKLWARWTKLLDPDATVVSAQGAFAAFWEKNHGENSWAKNPWVWRYRFKLIENYKAA